MLTRPLQPSRQHRWQAVKPLLSLRRGSFHSSCHKPLQVQRRSRRQSPWDAGTSQPRDSSQETEMSRRYSVDPKRWTDHKKLDLDMKPEGFVAWRDRALGYLAAERPDRKGNSMTWKRKQANWQLESPRLSPSTKST